jgi:tRNA-Thr(GGU) m(6)t(6)A37 methyltransferase TsaA
MDSLKSIRLKPIGFVRTEAGLEDLRHRVARSEIVVNKKLCRGLDGIGGFSHIFVLYWMHKTSKSQREILTVHPRHRSDIPKQGIFATRSKFHPNTIGLTIVKLLKKTGNTLIVKGLDAYDGTPVLDLKPYDYWDRPKKIRVPAWWKRLEKERRGDQRFISHLSI